MSTVTFEIASSEFEKWLNEKGVSTRRREGLKEMEEELIDAIESGSLVLDKNIQFVQTLKFPNSKIKVLTFKTRIQVGMINARLKGLKSDDVNGRLESYISVLTGATVSEVKTLDSTDFTVASCIATYFL